MIDWSVAWSGWATALTFTVIGSWVARWWIDRRELLTIRQVAKVDVLSKVRFLSYALQLRLHPDRQFRYPTYLSRDLFPIWAPQALRRWPAVAREITILHGLAIHVENEIRDGEIASVWMEGHIDVLMMAARISDELGLDLGDWEDINISTAPDYYRDDGDLSDLTS